MAPQGADRSASVPALRLCARPSARGVTRDGRRILRVLFKLDMSDEDGDLGTTRVGSEYAVSDRSMPAVGNEALEIGLGGFQIESLRYCLPRYETSKGPNRAFRCSCQTSQ